MLTSLIHHPSVCRLQYYKQQMLEWEVEGFLEPQARTPAGHQGEM